MEDQAPYGKNTNTRPTIKVKIQLLPGAKMPKYETPGSVGMDLYANIAEPIEILPGEQYLIPTGVKMQIEEGFEGQIRPKSGLKLKGLEAHLGTIDDDFVNEIKVIMYSKNGKSHTIIPGQKIAQIVFVPVVRAILVDEPFEETERKGGFGSTGIL